MYKFWTSNRGANPPIFHRLSMKVIIDRKILENEKIVAR